MPEPAELSPATLFLLLTAVSGSLGYDRGRSGNSYSTVETASLGTGRPPGAIGKAAPMYHLASGQRETGESVETLLQSFHQPLLKMFHSPKMARTSSFQALALFTLTAVSLCASQEAPTVRGVAVLRASEAVEIEIQISQRLTPQVQVLSGPDRIVVDFPGALPGPGLRSVVVQRGEVKRVRTGLFEARPPITRVVLDLKTAQDYQLVPSGKAVMVKVGGTTHMASGVAPTNPTAPASPPTMQAPPPPPPLTVGFQDGLLSIAADRASLAEVLYQIQVQTGAEIAVPSGVEQEKVSATLGPALACAVLAQLLDGSPYNLIILGSFEDSSSLDRVILTPKLLGFSQLNPMPPPPPPPARTPPQRLVEQAPQATPGSGADQVPDNRR
ncbi:MAG TPA: AMIN domain-containing protein [Terriglobales bacterium]|nr:AMIN domain-containing protein [Terriglobales bacterium]